MPRLGGRALYEQLADERPQLAYRFVFVTGDQARGRGELRRGERARVPHLRGDGRGRRLLLGPQLLSACSAA
jgi:hypothetical protein